MSDKWLEHMAIVEHPFWERFAYPSAMQTIWREASVGIPCFVVCEDESWLRRAKDSKEAVDRIGDMVMMRLKFARDPEYRRDLMTALEDCEEEESFWIAEKYMEHYRPTAAAKFDSAPSAKLNAPTAAQLNLLRQYDITDFRGSRQEASNLIDELKKEQKRRKR